MTSAAPDLDQSPGRVGPRPNNGWGTALLLVFAVFDGLELAVLILAGDAVGIGFRIVTAIGVVGALAIIVTVIVGLQQERPWARPTAVGVLWMLVISAAIDLMTGLGSGRLTIPILAIAALLVLRSWRRADAAPNVRARPRSTRDRNLALGLVAGFVVAVLVWPALLDWLATPGYSPLAVTSSSVTVAATLDCRAFGAAAGTGAANASSVPIPASLAWQWSEHEYLPGGTDSLAIRWSLTLPDGSDPEDGTISLVDAPGIHVDGSSTSIDASPGGPFSVGLSSSATTLADQLVNSGGGSIGQGFPVSIDVGQQHLRDDRFDFDLQGDPAAAVHGTLTLEGYYIHRDLWSAGPASATCSW